MELGAAIEQERTPVSHLPAIKMANRSITVNRNCPSNALRHLFHCRVGCVSGKAQPEHCVLKKHLPWALMRSRSAPHLRGFIPRGLSRLKHRWRAGHRRLPGVISKKHLANLSAASEASTNGSSLNLKRRCHMERRKPRSAPLIQSPPPNQPMERTPPCCARRRRSSAR